MSLFQKYCPNCKIRRLKLTSLLLIGNAPPKVCIGCGEKYRLSPKWGLLIWFFSLALLASIASFFNIEPERGNPIMWVLAVTILPTTHAILYKPVPYKDVQDIVKRPIWKQLLIFLFFPLFLVVGLLTLAVVYLQP